MNKKISEAIEGKICAHIACGCEAEAGSDYCSPQCKKSAAVGETDCNCGHAECQARA